MAWRSTNYSATTEWNIHGGKVQTLVFQSYTTAGGRMLHRDRTYMRLWNSNMDLRRLPNTNLNNGAVDRATNFSSIDQYEW